MIETPVAISFDDQGRMFVVEMRGYMRDLTGSTEKEPSGRVSLLTDTDGDGRMDRATAFVDQVVMPRSVLAVNGGALIAVPPELILCRRHPGHRPGRQPHRSGLRLRDGGRTARTHGQHAGVGAG